MNKLEKELLFLIEDFEDGRISAYQLVKLIKKKLNE